MENIANKIRVVLADRDGAFQECLKTFLEKSGKAIVIGMADNGTEALELMKRTRADVLLIDVLLGESDGLWVLEEIGKAGIKLDVCIMISAIDSEKVVRRAMSLGADYFMAKPISPSILLERMEKLYIGNHGIENRQNVSGEMEAYLQEPQSQGLISLCKQSENMEAEISGLLSRMGMPASIKGYHYIRKAIMMAVENEEVLIGITKGLYPDIGKNYNTTASKVERAIRHAIESAWKRDGQMVFTRYSGYHSEGKPTNGQFIATISEYFRLLKKSRFRSSDNEEMN